MTRTKSDTQEPADLAVYRATLDAEPELELLRAIFAEMTERMDDHILSSGERVDIAADLLDSAQKLVTIALRVRG
jgi:hypothetical protein